MTSSQVWIYFLKMWTMFYFIIFQSIIFKTKLEKNPKIWEILTISSYYWVLILTLIGQID